MNSDWDANPGGDQPAGTYLIEDDKITVTMVLVRGSQKSQPFKVEGSAASEQRNALVEKIVTAILAAQNKS